MSSSANVYVVVEGQTEQTFIRDILAPALGLKNIFLHAVLIGKPGHKGGNVRFDRAKIDIGGLLRQRQETYISTMFDYYAIDSRWPGLAETKSYMSASRKGETVEAATLSTTKDAFEDYDVEGRFIPYVEMHEFEAMLFSDTTILAEKTSLDVARLQDIVEGHGEPEEINSGPTTAPSKRILSMRPNYKKVVMGKTIAEAIGIEKIRQECPHFNAWLEKFESLVE